MNDYDSVEKIEESVSCYTVCSIVFSSLSNIYPTAVDYPNIGVSIRKCECDLFLYEV